MDSDHSVCHLGVTWGDIDIPNCPILCLGEYESMKCVCWHGALQKAVVSSSAYSTCAGHHSAGAAAMQPAP